MSMQLFYEPVNWKMAPMPVSNNNGPQAFVDVLDKFDIENSYDSDYGYDFEVLRDDLKLLRDALTSGEYTEEQDETYKEALRMLHVTHDEFLKTLSALLQVRTDYIRLSWS